MNDPLIECFQTGDKEIWSRCRQVLNEAHNSLDLFKRLPDTMTDQEVLQAFDRLCVELDWTGSVAGLFFQVHPDAEMREEAANLEQEMGRFFTELSLDREVFDRLFGLDAESLSDPVARRVLDHALRDFRRAGVDQDEPARERIKALREELVVIGQEFARNIATDVREIRVPEADISDLPSDWVDGHPSGDDGMVVVTTNPTDYLPFMKYCSRREHRKALLHQFHTRGCPKNLEVLERMLARRYELAQLLGYEHWADYITEDKMIKNAENAASFIDRVVSLTGARIDEECAELLEVIRKDHPEVDQVRDFDRLYYQERIRAEKFGFDAKEIRPYLAFDKVTQGVMDTVARLFDVTFSPAQVPVWHEDVMAFNVEEKGEVIARLFLDMHPREDKYKHAAMFDLCCGIEGERIPQASLICNFPKPGGDDAGLMEAGQVTTYFHEFGHLMHHLLAGRHQWLSVSGIATEWDFVEVPSQLFEEWSRDPEVLSSFATHHDSGEVVPAELVERMRAAENYGKGLYARIQMLYATVALEYYCCDPDGLDTSEVIRKNKDRLLPLNPYEEGTFFQASFGHLDGYSAIYYTYMWSLVLAKDIFSAFAEGDLMDTTTSRRYREKVLAPGGSRDAADLVADFLGRPSDFEAFEDWLKV
ncbi:MAG: M3 family metallopeptidase [Planctomycetota bacterium]|nr:M3 family metallopeptidase [Planctomycetota bacterium]